MARLDRKSRRAVQPRQLARAAAREEAKSMNMNEMNMKHDMEYQNQDACSSASSADISRVPSPVRSHLVSVVDGEARPARPGALFASPGASSYREKLRATGQQALRRVRDSGVLRTPIVHDPLMQAMPGDRLFSSYSPLHTTPHLTPGDWHAMNLTPPPSPMVHHSPSLSPVRLPSSRMVWAPATLGCAHVQEPVPSFGFEEMPEAGLMAIAMPQAMSLALDKDRIAAELRAAAPCLYED